MKKLNHEGFSLVEMIIAIAITSFVMMGVIALLAYSTRSMNDTQARIELQNEAKDAMNHITTYVMEGNKVTWDDAKKALIVKKDTITNEGVTGAAVSVSDEFYYWAVDGGLYFANATAIDPTALTADKSHFLADNVEDFVCEVKRNADTKKVVLHVELTLKDDVSQFVNKKDIYLRNQ